MNLGSVQRYPLIIRSGSILIKHMLHLSVHIFNGSHNIALSFRLQTEVVTDTTCQAYAMLVTVILIQSTVACWLIGMEKAFKQEARCAMTEHAKVTFVHLSIATGRRILMAIEVDITAQVLVFKAISAVMVNEILPVIRPTSICHRPTALR